MRILASRHAGSRRRVSTAFGAAQSSSLAVMVEDARPRDLPAVSALWKAGYDLGLRLGPMLFGMAFARSSAPTALMLEVCALAACLPSARRRP